MVASRFSPRARWILGISAAALLYGAFVYWERSTWHPLPHGGEAKLFQIGFGREMRLKQRGLKLDAARKWLGPRFEFLLGPAPFEVRTAFGTPSLFVAFAGRNATVDDLPRTGYCEIDLPGGQILRGSPTTLGNVQSEKIDLVQFEVVPSSQKWLNVRLEFGGESLPFRLKNPAYTPIPASWNATPLPQTQPLGNLTVTLTQISVFRTFDSSAGSFWEARPAYSISFPENPLRPRRQPQSYARFCSPSGGESIRTAIFCDPVWNVRIHVFRPHNDDAPDSEVRWLGRMPLPGPGEGRLFSGSLGTPATKGHLCGLVGPGLYHVIDSKLIPIETSPDAPDDPPSEKAFIVQANAITLFFIDNILGEERYAPGFHASAAATVPAFFLRDQSGRRVEIQEPDYNPDRASQFRVIAVPGTAEVEIGLMPRILHADFYIPAPEPPAELPR